jgi:hypothetical protein
MGTRQGFVHLGQRVVAFLAMAVLTWATLGCAKPTEPTVLLSEPSVAPNRLSGQITEVSPPETLETLKQIIDAYTPQVRILSPRPGEIVENTTVSVRIQVRGLPLFKDETWQLGPHLHVFLDDQPYRAVYDLSAPLVFEDLSPGTHTLRVFASRPWHESFKNQGAFDQRTFHVFAPTPQKEVNASAPLLTYSRPQGTYGAEPIMLDFYLTNAPLHLSAQADAQDDLHDWRIRCTVNGQSFVFDQWQPIYLKGFQPGRNWVQLELIDEAGRPIDNRFNNTVRIVDYQPGGDDSLSRLVRGELDLRAIASIIDPTYVPPPAPAPELDQPESPQADQAPQAEGTPSQSSPTPPPVKPGVPTPVPPIIEPGPPEASQEQAPETPDAPDRQPVPGAQPAPAQIPSSLDSSSPPEAQEALEQAPNGAAAVPKPNPFLRPLAPEPSALEPAGPELDEELPLNQEDSLPPTGQPELEPEEKAEVEWPDVTPSAESDGGVVPVVPDPAPDPATDPKGPKGWMKRFKAWQDQQKAPPTPDPETSSPLEPIPIYQTPPTVSPEPKPEPDLQPEAEPEPEAVELPRVRPELIEPYLTQPYLTEPRTEALPQPSQSTTRDRDDAPVEEQAPSDPPKTSPPDQPQPSGTPNLNRPYI